MTTTTTKTKDAGVRNDDDDDSSDDDDDSEGETTTKQSHVVEVERGDETQPQQQKEQEPNGHTILRIPYLNPEGQGGVQHANTESTQRCNFPMTSQFIKVLQPSLVVYRNLTMSV